MFCGLNAKKSLPSSNIENLVAKIRSVKFSILLRIFLSFIYNLDPSLTDCNHAEDAGVRCSIPAIKSYSGYLKSTFVGYILAKRKLYFCL